MEEEIIVNEEKKARRKAASAKYYNIPEEELQEMVLLAKRGDERAQQELLKVFNNFILKYTALLFDGKFDLHDYDIRRFVSLFATDKGVQFKLRGNKIDTQTYRHVQECMRGIKFMVRRYAEKIDVKQTVQMTFLQCVMRYERKGSIPFSGYIYSYFFFLLKKNVDQFLIYQLGRRSFPLYTDDNVSSSYQVGEESAGTLVPLGASAEDLLGVEEVDEYWVLGDTAPFPFSLLSIQQRQLIKWRYVDNLKASQIALKTSEHPNTCRAQLQEIKEQLKKILDEEI